MSYYYIRISRAYFLSQRSLLQYCQLSSSNSLNPQSNLMTRRTDTRYLNVSITAICIVYLISYAPFAIYHVMELAGATQVTDSLVKNFSVLLISINSFSNPLIFASTYYKRKMVSKKRRFPRLGRNHRVISCKEAVKINAT
ncbi:hypothetical protein TrispH2_009985 [Trichoplax sp. H2]|nr:hypothetical protein TrispH2_009985 [Trichoplax sp. H2]|eukprot:RDD39009.1 hypothetical protein TrispH2_009985 [Trichoplax sp. H2]